MGSNPACQPFDFEHTIDLGEPRLIITCRNALPTVLNVSSRKGIQRDRVFLFDESQIDSTIDFLHNPAETALSPLSPNEDHQAKFGQLLGHGQNDWVTLDEPTSKRTPAAMFSTSGTGGLPKAAVLSHHALISWHSAVHHESPYCASRLIAIPMFHNFSAIWTHFFPTRYGHPLFILPEFKLSSFLKAVSKHQVTETYLVPVMIHMLNQSTAIAKNCLSSLRYVGVAGAPIDKQSMQRFQDMLDDGACAGQMWGMTEVGIAFQNRYCSPLEQYDKGSIGRLLPGYECRLVSHDSGSIIVDDDRPGELEIRGSGLLMSYKGLNDAKSNGGWFATGDMAMMKNGHYFIVGRTKELIKVRG